MIHIRYVQEEDRAFWFRLDRHLPETEFERKVRDQMGYVALDGGAPIGLLRYNLFWDNTPFCTMLFVDGNARERGCGTALMTHWEAEMRTKGFPLLMTSTQADETAQHFYRKLGYRDAGCLLPVDSGLEQAAELFFTKAVV